MKTERQTEIRLVTERSISIKSSRALTAWCAPCGREVQMFTPGQTALVTGLTAREVYRQVEAGRVHFVETVEGLLLVCLDSLLAEQGRLAAETLRLLPALKADHGEHGEHGEEA